MITMIMIIDSFNETEREAIIIIIIITSSSYFALNGWIVRH